MPPPKDHRPESRPERTPSQPTPKSGGASDHSRRRRWPWIVGGIALVLVAFIALFDWNWLRGPAERYASNSMGRTVTIGRLDLRWQGLAPRVVLSDVAIGNPEWGGSAPMAQARELMFSVRLLTLLSSNIIVPHLRLSDADVNFMRDVTGRTNWRFRESSETGKRNVQVLTLAVDDVRVGYADAIHDVWMSFHGFTRKEGPYETRIGFAGRWREGAIEGTADTGSILSLRGSTQPFPMRIVGKAGKTSVQAEGEVADITRFRHINADFAISGPSLASLYPVLHIALPETPPYRARGQLKRDDDLYAYENFKGTIGGSDIAGSARYELRKPRPMLSAELNSRILDIADLGPLVGLGTSGAARAGTPAVRPATPRPPRPLQTAKRVLPDNPFNLEKLNAMDADVRLTATRLRIPEQVPLEDFAARARLDAGVMTLEPLNFGFAGGDLVAKVVLDARNDPIAANIAIDLKRVKLSELFPTLDQLKQSGGSLGAQVRLAGRGNSVAAMLGSSSGTVAAGMAGGRVSEIAVWLINLNGGELIPLLFGGDRPTPVRCGAAAMDVKDGAGTITMFVFDTEESRITGSGSVDLRNERLDITLRPEAKKPGMLSIRGPIRIHGTFSDVDFAVAPQSIARGVGAIALGFVNPILSLLPLIETGEGKDANCQVVLAPVKGALAQSGKSPKDAPAAGENVERDEPAPIVNVPPGNATARSGREGTVGLEQNEQSRQPAAPIVNVPPKK